MMTQTTAEYFEAFFDEKDLPLDDRFEVEGPVWGTNSMTYRVVVDAIKTTSGDEADAIANMLRRIDFANGDVLHFLRHLAQGLAL